MQKGLDADLVTYNTNRPHQGQCTNGRTPLQAFGGRTKTSEKTDKNQSRPIKSHWERQISPEYLSKTGYQHLIYPVCYLRFSGQVLQIAADMSFYQGKISANCSILK